jgi:integrase
MAEGVGFEPTVALRLLLISSQVPLTTQPPFRSLITRNLEQNIRQQIDNPILVFDTDRMAHQRGDQGPVRGESPWEKTSYANLVRYAPSAVYFARIRIGGKLIRRSLETTVLSVAKLKLTDLEKDERGKLEKLQKSATGNSKFGDLMAEYRKRLEINPTIKAKTRTYYSERIAAILKSWPGIAELDVRRIKPEDCEIWAGRYVKQVSPTNFNNSIGVVRSILQIAVERGHRYSNPADGLKRTKVKKKDLTLPSQSQFLDLVKEIRRVPFGPGLASADLVEFLAFGGFRKSEAANVLWEDCDFHKGEIVVRGDPETGTKNGESRRVPMIPDMRRLLERLRESRPDAKQVDRVMRVKECQGAITRACQKLEVRRFTHHDLRHLFATRCIESGVDIPTVARWLGHKDGGALAMKVYGHLRDQHSSNMAQRVTFDASPPTKDELAMTDPSQNKRHLAS